MDFEKHFYSDSGYSLTGIYEEQFGPVRTVIEREEAFDVLIDIQNLFPIKSRQAVAVAVVLADRICRK